tara:strand:- start:841 stop:1917 length:1077 start_codon:yes stop_codon:yes gene_type:complete
MLIFKKKIFIYLYIFFLNIVLILSEFSTNYTYANGYEINNVQIEDSYDLNFNKEKVIDKAFYEAFKILIYKIVDKNDRLKFENIELNIIKSLVDSFSITDEKFIKNKYQSQFDVEFNRKKTLVYIESRKVISALPKELDVLIIPILVNVKKNQIYYLNENIFYNIWNKDKKNYHLINYILPNEDVEDYLIIKKNQFNIENYNFEEIVKKYNIKNTIFLIMFEKENQLKILSRLNLNQKSIIVTNIFSNYLKNDKLELNNIILELKDIFEDKWKSSNKLNTSIALPIRIAIDTKNIELSEKLEKIISRINLISDYKIEKFNSEKIIYKIIFNSTPDKFLESMLSFNLKIDTSKELWELK